MRKPQLSSLSKSFDALLKEKRSLSQKEEQVIARLNKVLEQLGYRVERSRPFGSTATKKIHRTRRRLKADTSIDRQPDQGSRRRGRPPLRRVA